MKKCDKTLSYVEEMKKGRKEEGEGDSAVVHAVKRQVSY
jgi:hypothetical protein